MPYSFFLKIFSQFLEGHQLAILFLIDLESRSKEEGFSLAELIICLHLIRTGAMGLD